MVHNIFLNRTCGVLVCQQNVALAIMNKTEVSPDEGRTDTRLTLDDATVQSQSK